jgi:hypothetical protein
MVSWGGPADPFGDDERDAVARLLAEIRNACNANVSVDRGWRLLGVVAAVAGMASNDVKAGDATKRLHRHCDTLTEAVAQLEERPGG